MNAAVDFVVLNLFKTLKLRNMECKLYSDTIFEIMKLCIDYMEVSPREKEEILEEMDLDFELDCLSNNYSDNISYHDDVIYLDDIGVKDIDKMIEEVSMKYNEKELTVYEDTMVDEVIIIEMLGITIHKKLYYYLLDVEGREEEIYRRDYTELDDSEYQKRIKRLTFEKFISIFNMKNNINKNVLYDVVLYAISRNECKIAYNYSSMNDNNKNADRFPIKNNGIEFDILADDPFQRAIFFVSENASFNLQRRLEMEFMNYNSVSDEKNFYLCYLNFLEEEMGKINKMKGNQLEKAITRKRLSIVKMRLMNSLDTIYDTSLFLGNKYEVEPNVDKMSPYVFMKKEALFLIDEIFAYTDEEYEKALFTMLNNTIKMLYIKTYYYLTADPDIKDRIENNSLNGINGRSSEIISDILGDNDTKKKIKK